MIKIMMQNKGFHTCVYLKVFQTYRSMLDEKTSRYNYGSERINYLQLATTFDKYMNPKWKKLGKKRTIKWIDRFLFLNNQIEIEELKQLPEFEIAYIKFNLRNTNPKIKSKVKTL